LRPTIPGRGRRPALSTPSSEPEPRRLLSGESARGKNGKDQRSFRSLERSLGGHASAGRIAGAFNLQYEDISAVAQQMCRRTVVLVITQYG